MNHLSLDKLDESVKQFVLSATLDSEGSILELNGRAVACLVPPARLPNESADEEWTKAKNARRAELIRRKHTSGLTPEEFVELAGLQEAMLRYRQKVAPFPIEDARRLHQELLKRAAEQSPK